MIRTDGYSTLSILVHWLAAVLVVSLFFTHEGERGSGAYVFHVSGGAVAGLFLLWRVWHRVRRGAAAAPDQWGIFNLAARTVHWGLLAAVVVVVVSGYLLPWTLGQELDVFGLGIPSPMGANRGVHEVVERVHDVAGHLFVPLGRPAHARRNQARRHRSAGRRASHVPADIRGAVARPTHRRRLLLIRIPPSYGGIHLNHLSDFPGPPHLEPARRPGQFASLPRVWLMLNQPP